MASVDEIPDLRTWQAAYAAFRECVGGDQSAQISYGMAWTAVMNAVMGYVMEMNSRKRDG